MSKFGLENKSKSIGVVINPPKGKDRFDVETYDKLDLWLNDVAEQYAYITHDLDVLEDGTPKTTHIHMYASLKVCQRLYTSLNKIADVLGFENEQIQIEKCTSPEALIQYMTHKHNPDKHQYRVEEIRTNLDEGELKAVMDADTENCSVEYFIGLCASEINLLGVIRKLGIPRYQAYRNIVLDIWKECHK